MATQLINNHRENAEIYNGDELCQQKLKELLKEINIPSVLFHMVDIQEFGYNKSTGFMWVTQKNPVQHKFNKMKRIVSYDTHVTAFVEHCKMKKVHGVKSKELLVWLTLSDFYVEDGNSHKITIGNPSGITKDIPISNFEE